MVEMSAIPITYESYVPSVILEFSSGQPVGCNYPLSQYDPTTHEWGVSNLNTSTDNQAQFKSAHLPEGFGK